MSERLFNRFRPTRFGDVVGQKSVVTSLQNQVRNGRFMQVSLFHGQFGGGKTTMARIFANAAVCERPQDGEPCGCCEQCRTAISGENPNIIELDAASHTGVDDIREIIESSRYLPNGASRKVYIIDEVHKLSSGAFNALLKTLEEPPSYCLFLFCTTEVEKVPSTIRSRSANYKLRSISDTDMIQRLQHVCREIGCSADENVLRLISKYAKGSLRDALGILEQVETCPTEEAVQAYLGLEDVSVISELVSAVARKNVPDIVDMVETMTEEGKDYRLAAADALDVVADVITAMVSGVINGTERYCSVIGSLATVADVQEWFRVANAFMSLRSALARCNEKAVVVLELARACHEEENLAARVKELEEKVRRLESLAECRESKPVGIRNEAAEITAEGVENPVEDFSQRSDREFFGYFTEETAIMAEPETVFFETEPAAPVQGGARVVPFEPRRNSLVGQAKRVAVEPAEPGNSEDLFDGFDFF